MASVVGLISRVRIVASAEPEIAVGAGCDGVESVIGPGKGELVMASVVGLISPISPCVVANQRLPPGPAVIPLGANHQTWRRRIR